jgi:hypothetical protein
MLGIGILIVNESLSKFSIVAKRIPCPSSFDVSIAEGE